MLGRCQLQKLLLIALLLVYAGLASWYSVVIPLGEAPDEVDHYGVIRYLVQHRRLPTTQAEHEAVQPPLYYLVGAALSGWIPDHEPYAVWHNADFDLSDPLAPRTLLLHPAAQAWPYRGWALAWHLVRLWSVALGALTVWAVYHLGGEIFPARPEIGLGMAALTAFTPQFLFTTAIANNDSAAAALSALVLWQIVALLRHGRLHPARIVLLGLLLGLGLLSKSSLLALLPVAGLAILWIGWGRRPAGVKALLLAWLLAFGLAGLISAPYYLRNWRAFGDPLGFSFVMATNPLRDGPLTPGVLAWLFRGVARSFWLQWIGIQLDEWLYAILFALYGIGLAGFLAWLWVRWRRIPRYVRQAIVLLGLHAAITLALLIRWTTVVRGTDNARLVLPLLPTAMLVLVGGLLVWMSGRARYATAGWLAGMWLVLAVVTPARYLAPVYAAAPTLDRLPDAATPLDVRFGEAIRLAGAHLAEPQVRPGERLTLDLYWVADAPLTADVWLLLELVDASGEFVMYKDGSPSAGRDTTDCWTLGTIVAARHRLAVPDEAPPGLYWITLSLHPAGDRTWLPTTTAEGEALADAVVLEPAVRIEP
ncbi:MAG: glycosyltransferase family 39 protein [Anaerolineae bacterium]|jgi:hypothetical protein